jgi:ketosteroid isomerase-like protein
MKTAEELQNAAIVRRYLELYNSGQVEQAVGETMVEALQWEWAATPLYSGASGQTRDGFLQGLVRGLDVEGRGLSTRSLVVDGDLVVHRGDYTGSIGNLRFDAQLFQFYTLRDGAITRIEEVAYMPPGSEGPSKQRGS